MTNIQITEAPIEHTPGPWEDNGSGLIYGPCSGEDDEAPFVADVCHDPNCYTDQEYANARLIAAAPALLEALRLARRALSTAVCFRAGEADSDRIAARVDRAIEMASGRRES